MGFLVGDRACAIINFHNFGLSFSFGSDLISCLCLYFALFFAIVTVGVA